MTEQLTTIINELINADSCNDALRATAGAFLDAAGTDGEKDAAKALMAKLVESVNTIDESLSFFKSEIGRKVFGEAADGMIASFEAAKEKGEKFCLCPACQVGAKLYDLLSAEYGA